MQTVIFQSAKLGDIPQILAEFDRATKLYREGARVERIYGISGGALVALAFALNLSARQNPGAWCKASSALAEFSTFLRQAPSRHIRAINLNPLYGIYNLQPLRKWIASRLGAYADPSLLAMTESKHACSVNDLKLSHLAVPLYLCAIDQDATFTLFGLPGELLQFQYHAVQVGPPRDAPILDALIAALSTMLSTEPARVNDEWYRDCRPAIVDAGAIVADLQHAEPNELLRTLPHAPVRPWKQNWITSSFIMHSQNERNQVLLASYYLDLLKRHRILEDAYTKCYETEFTTTYKEPLNHQQPRNPQLGHIDLPYVGSTEAFTNMRQSVNNKDALMTQFRELLQGQLEGFSFDQPANIVYGAGGFSGILAGLITTRAVDAGFAREGGDIQQIYGVSAGVLNGFFHAVQLAAERHPDLYTRAARNALSDLEDFIASITPKKVAKLNLNPCKFWHGWANLGPLEEFLLDRLATYTGSKYPAQITFDDIGLPMTIAAARLDGFTDFLGMAEPDRHMRFGKNDWQVRPAPVVRAILAGWSMNTYISPTALGDQTYTDGGGTFYDIGLFVACMDPELTNLLNVHLDEPEGHSYNLPPQPSLVRIVFDTHNYIFPEERRRMRFLTDLLYQHYRLRARYVDLSSKLPGSTVSQYLAVPPDFRRIWKLEEESL